MPESSSDICWSGGPMGKPKPKGNKMGEALRRAKSAETCECCKQETGNEPHLCYQAGDCGRCQKCRVHCTCIDDFQAMLSRLEQQHGERIDTLRSFVSTTVVRLEKLMEQVEEMKGQR